MPDTEQNIIVIIKVIGFKGCHYIYRSLGIYFFQFQQLLVPVPTLTIGSYLLAGLQNSNLCSNAH